MGTPKLSICIATYNRGKFIGETMDSILCQPLHGVEIVVVDGASPDNTQEVMARYVSRHPEVHYYREEENSGVDCDYDKAVGYANGKYCWLMTDDDLMKSGALTRILGFLDGPIDLVVVNAEVRNVDFSKVLKERMIDFREDREYGMEDVERFFSEVAGYLSFIGGVVIRRDSWLQRNRSLYYGTLFVHVGVIFQLPPIKKVKVVADPLIIIRYGSAMWTPRSFEIWMFKWPELIWSFRGFSDRSKGMVCPREPWRRAKRLVLYRATGGYSLAEYRRFLSGKANGMSRLFPLSIAVIPAFMVNILLSLYCVLVNRKARFGIYDLSRSRHATWVSRLGARILNV
jgi:glycosyltransferase involved in cell wall biosynthesis